MNRSARVVVACAVIASSAACFVDDAVDPHALILCRSDHECPSNKAHCDLASHTCVAPGAIVDVNAPELLDASFAPEVAGATSAPVLTIDVDEALDASPTFTFAGAVSLGLTPIASASTTSLSFAVDVADALEGTYALESVHLVDKQHNEADRAPPHPATLVLDRTAPVLSSVSVDDGTASDTAPVFADEPGHDAMRVSFLASEPIDVASVIITVEPSGQRAPFDCEARTDVALGFACTGTLAPGGPFVDGDNTLLITASDLAGNAGAQVAGGAVVDAAAPSIVAGSLSIVTRTASGKIVDALTPGGTLDVSFVLTEEPTPAPTLFLDTGAQIPVDVVVDHRFVHATLTYAPTPSDPTGPVDLVGRFVDAVGHDSGDVVIGTVTLAQVVPSPCTLAALPGAPGCVDADGDGQPGFSPTCPGFTDCDDTDPTVGLGFPEIPGDGLDNGCTGAGDTPIADGFGVFFQTGAPTTASGHADDPIGDLASAIVLAESRGQPQWVFLAKDTATVPQISTTVGMVGGLDPAIGWLRTSEPTSLSHANVEVDAPVAIEGVVDVNIDNATAGAVYLRTGAFVHASAPFTFVGGTLQQNTAYNGLDDLRIIGATVVGGLAFLAGRATILDTTLGGIEADNGANVTVVSSVLVHPSASSCSTCAAVCFGCDAIRLVHSNVLSSAAVNGIGVDVNGGHAEIIDSAVVLASPGSIAVRLHDTAADSATIVGSDFDAEKLLEAPSVVVLADDNGLAQLNAANAPGLDALTRFGGGFAGSVLGNPNVSATPPAFFTVDPPSPAVGAISLAAAAALVPALNDGSVPTSIAADFEGDCRFVPNGTVDIGPDQR